MDECLNTNYAEFCGTMVSAPVYSHSGRGERFYTFPLEVQRLSGVFDRINVVARRELLDSISPGGESKLLIIGEVRSFNNKSGEGAKLVITVFAKEISLCDEDDRNIVQLSGTICKTPNLRTTPTGRDICDIMLAVNRRYGRSDYLPCIAWGSRAQISAAWDVGVQVRLSGRLQSRNYIKLLDGEATEKTAFEISATEIEEI